MYDHLETKQLLATERHTTAYLAAGPADGPLVIFVHGWPECSRSWRYQLPFFAAMGFRAIAPDMRGYGQSSVYDQHEDYCLEVVVQDMLELIDALGRGTALWVGHDWGSPVVWSIASHHPERCHGVASLCVPYQTIELGVDSLVERVDRTIYPQQQYPAGQWDYMYYYAENFAASQNEMESNPRGVIKALFRRGDPGSAGKPTLTAKIRRKGGWFGGLRALDELPLDTVVIDEEDLAIYADNLVANGFFGPNSWYMNHQANASYTKQAENQGVLAMPALFLAARYDYVCECIDSSLPDLMREQCLELTEEVIDSGHWMAQECPTEVNSALIKWIVRSFPQLL